MSADPLIALRRALAPEAVAAIEELVEQRATDIVERRLDAAQLTQRKPWLTVREAAVMLGCSEVAVRHRVRRGRLQGRFQGRRLYVATGSIVDLGAYAADPRRGTSTTTPARRQSPGVRSRRKEKHP
jgi:hypothetical protein